ncbi:NR2CA protein, partial [Polypterus senegalus]
MLLVSFANLPASLFRVSSVLNRDSKQFGKKHLFDGHEETCWNSDQGAIQWVLLEFPQMVKISEVRLQFQGGFASTDCRLEGCGKNEDVFTTLATFYPEDKNSLQISFYFFHFPIHGDPLAHKLKIVFENSTDFFGRIIVYKLDVLGEKL